MQILKSDNEDKEEWVLEIPEWMNEDIKCTTQKEGKVEGAKSRYRSGRLSQSWPHKKQILKESWFLTDLPNSVTAEQTHETVRLVR